ncbi:putative CheA signal transduction histidine kinase [Halorubrum distributum JCM 13916]|uniref:Putative CheA signal transduction histidine kinase n=2 Tax=Halorubrum distributum TaxID=29283 RepID=M0PL15_9EURY|nr:putative CheA signal transduction histidine kinase [Halorubrum arcis JCM 13916]
MRATIAQEGMITEADVSASGDGDGVTNEDLLVAIQSQNDISNRVQSSAESETDPVDYEEYSLDRDDVTDEMALILREYDEDADVLPDAMTPDDRGDVLSKEMLKTWVGWEESKMWAPPLNPDHVIKDERPDGMPHAVALTWGVLRYQDSDVVRVSEMVDVMDEDLGWTRTYMMNQGFEEEIKERVVQDPLEDSKYHTDYKLYDDRLYVVAAKAENALDRIEAAESFDTISSAKSDALRYGSMLDGRESIRYICDGRWDQMADDFADHVKEITADQKRVLAEQAVTDAEKQVVDIGEMMRGDESDVDVSDIRSVISQIESEKQSVQDMQSGVTNKADFTGTLSDLDSILSDAAVAMAHALTIEIRSMTDEIDESDDVLEIESTLDKIEGIADDAVEAVEDHATEDHSDVVDSVEEALSAAEDRHDDAREVALEREVAAAEEVEAKWADRANRVFEIAESPFSKVWMTDTYCIFRRHDAVVDDFEDHVADEVDYVMPLDYDWEHITMDELLLDSQIENVEEYVRDGMAIVNAVEDLDLDVIECREDAREQVAENVTVGGDSVSETFLETKIYNYSHAEDKELSAAVMVDEIDDADEFRADVASAVFEFESAVTGDDDDWWMLEEGKAHKFYTPGALRVDMREYTDFDRYLDPDEIKSSKFESRRPDDSESGSVEV